MTFDEWLDENDREFRNYICYEEYHGSVIELLELAWEASRINLAQRILNADNRI
jgi:hypothetical protein